jgi:riboflavin kinase
MREKRQGPTAQQLVTLVELYKQGAGEHAISLSTTELGKLLGLTQQAVSQQLIQLEAKGMVERRHAGRGATVMVTPKGADQVFSFYTKLKGSVEGRPSTVVIHGRVFTGFGEGAYYISRPGYVRQFKRLLGFEPFPGTLNLTINSTELYLRRQLNSLQGLEVKGFKDGKRTYGPVKCLRARIEGEYDAAALVIERTHHGEAVLELIAPVHLRKALGLDEGDWVSVAVSEEK